MTSQQQSKVKTQKHFHSLKTAKRLIRKEVCKEKEGKCSYINSDKNITSALSVLIQTQENKYLIVTVDQCGYFVNIKSIYLFLNTISATLFGEPGIRFSIAITSLGE